ncbi:Mg2+ and Co2+ transporter-like protein [Methylobacterium sp. J-026]|uniref:CorA family divalent cation transporter n=1 Tax=Methylobacterium sp. J-026 TaxID=2836624 RepID=UPI001FBBCA1F|nr:CorA family divalent cation transporter [Methylobacterium sp. J-026]MCJ2136002.1 Mg2+ and Co2+ transporter-like protein [Methylobacterium sp. J-026]
MILTFVRGETCLHPLDRFPAEERRARLAQSLWVDLLAATPEECALVSATLGVELFSPDELHEIEESSRIFVEGDALNLICWLPSFEADVPVNLPVGLIADRQRLISMRQGEFQAFRTYAEPRRRSGLPRVDTAADMLVDLLDTLVGQLASTLRMVEQDLNALTTEIFADGEAPRGGIRRAGGLRRRTSFRDLKAIVQRLGRRNALVANLRESAVTVATIIPFIVTNERHFAGPETVAQLKLIGKDVASLRDYNGQLSAEISFLLDSTMGLITIDENQSMKFLGVAALVVAFV